MLCRHDNWMTTDPDRLSVYYTEMTEANMREKEIADQPEYRKRHRYRPEGRISAMICTFALALTCKLIVHCDRGDLFVQMWLLGATGGGSFNNDRL